MPAQSALTGRVVLGEHLGLVWPHGIAVLDRTVAAQQAIDLWLALQEATDLTQFFAQLSAATGQGLLELPAFGVAVHNPDGVHLAARGEFVVVAAQRARDGAESMAVSDERITGQAISTWVERRVAVVASVTIESADAAELELAGPAWPQVGGVFPAARVSVSLDRSDAWGGAAVALRADQVSRPVAKRFPGETPEPERPPVEAEVDAPHETPPDGPAEDPVSETAGDSAGVTASYAADDVAEGPENGAGLADSGMFEDLWGDQTIFTPPEKAAVRVTAVEEPELAPAAVSEPAAEPEVEPEFSGQAPVHPASSEETWVEPAPSPPPTRPGASPGFISWVPSPARAADDVEAPGHGVPGQLARDHGAEGVSPSDQLGDHDGHTVLQLPPLEGPAPTFVIGREGIVDGEPNLIVGVLCPSGHGNPQQRTACRVCGARLDVTPVRMPRPSLGRLSSSTGDNFELTGPVVVGRNPRASRFQGTDIPRLMAVPQAHVSASHLEIRLEGWSVLAVDLRSTNGTFLRRHSDPPVRLPEAPQLLVSEDVLDLGHGVHLTFMDLP